MNTLLSSLATGTGEAGSVLRAVVDNLPDFIYIKDLQSRILFSNRAHALALGARSPEEVVGKTDFDWFPAAMARQYREDEAELLQTGLTVNREERVVSQPTGEARWLETTKVALRDREGRICGLVGISRDITERKLTQDQLRVAHDRMEARAEERNAELIRKNGELGLINATLHEEIANRERTEQALARERLLLRTLIDNLPDCIYAKDAAGRKILANPADLKNLRCATEAEAIGKNDFDFFPPEIAEKFYADDMAVINGGKPVLGREEFFFDEEGLKHWLLTSKLPMRDKAGAIVGLMGIGRDITSLKTAEEKLDKVHHELMEASRQAGMAEVATGVLHNVGNVLNSVNVSAGLVSQKLRESKVDGLAKASRLIQGRLNDLATFLSSDPRGRQVPAYLEELSHHLEQEREEMQREVADLTRNIEHIKEIVSMQQNYAVAAGVVEPIALADLADDAVKIHAGAFVRHGITIEREYAALPTALVDKHKVLQILVNLLSNAKYACEMADNKTVTLRIAPSAEDRVQLQVIDHGMGIAPENLTRIFSQGFTTRKQGHGFGLHSGALAAAELGGSLSVHSAGLGRGATFTLELPLTSHKRALVAAAGHGDLDAA
jgi:PAS domain S-box-containing protein